MHESYWQILWQNLIHFGAPTTPVTLLEKVLRPVVVYLALVFALRWFGKRTLAQLNPFDLVVLLMLSNTVQNAIIGNDTSLMGGLIGAAALLGVNALLVRFYYRGASKDRIVREDDDVRLIAHGEIVEAAMHRFQINAGELTAKAHERGFDSLNEIEDAFLYPNGTIYFKGRHPDQEDRRHRELLERLDHLQRQIAVLKR
jgi:uncharacterized membrane protein YcaP (DUF421 family)